MFLKKKKAKFLRLKLPLMKYIRICFLKRTYISTITFKIYDFVLIKLKSIKRGLYYFVVKVI